MDDPRSGQVVTFGALMLVSADPERPFDEDDLDFAKHLGRRAAVAVDNARLYRQAERRARAALVVEHVADGVLLVNNDGVIRLWNPAESKTLVITLWADEESLRTSAEAGIQLGELTAETLGTTRLALEDYEVSLFDVADA